MIGMPGVMPDDPMAIAGCTRILEPPAEVAAADPLAPRFSVECSLQGMVNKDRFDLIAGEPVVEDPPLPLDVEGVGSDASEPTDAITAPLEVGQVGVPTGAVADVPHERTPAATAQVVHLDARRARIVSAERVVRFDGPAHRLVGAPGSTRRPDLEERVTARHLSRVGKMP